MPRLIGLVGLAQSGKDTAGLYLVHNHGFKKMSFGRKPKEICMEMFDLTEDQVETTYGKKTIDPRYGVTPRTILQHIATEGFRHIYPNVWCDYVMRQIFQNIFGRFVLTDVRFKEEADAIRKHGGILVKIVRTDYGAVIPFWRRCIDWLLRRGTYHKSERYPRSPDSDFNFVIRARTGEITKIQNEISRIAFDFLSSP